MQTTLIQVWHYLTLSPLHFRNMEKNHLKFIVILYQINISLEIIQQPQFGTMMLLNILNMLILGYSKGITINFTVLQAQKSVSLKSENYTLFA